MSSEKSCQTALDKSQAFIRFILDDISKTYTEVGGGGITSIRLSATNTFVVSISQEERIDQITYELDMDDACHVKIKHREASTSTPWEK